MSLTLLARLFGKNVEGAINDVNQAIAAANPEAALEVDREALGEKMRAAAQKLAVAQVAFAKEHGDVVQLMQEIAADQGRIPHLLEQHAAGVIDEATLNAIVDQLEANQARLPQEQEEADQAKAFLGECQQIFAAFQKELDEFDTASKKIQSQLATATAQEELAELQLERQQQLDNLRKGIGTQTTAIGALGKRLSEAQENAAAAKLLAQSGKREEDAASKVAAARAAADGAGKPTSAVDRLKAMAAANQPATATA